MSRAPGCAVCILSVALAAAGGQGPDYRTEVRAEPAQDAAGREEALRRDAPGAVEVIEVRGDARGRGVADVLAEAAGVQVQALGGLGRFAQVTVRGSSAEQVAVFLDGVPLNPAGGGVANLADVPLGHVERIEVFRGLGAAGLPGASRGAGGAVNIVTRTPAGRRRAEAEVGAGSFGARRARALGSVAGEAGGVTAYVESLAVEGDFPYLSDHGTPLNGADDARVVRRNNAVDQLSGHVRAEVRPGGAGGPGGPGAWTWTAAVDGLTADREVPQVGALNGDIDADLTTRSALATVEASRPAGGDGQFAVGVDASWRAERLRDPAGAVGLGGPRDVEGRTSAAGVHARATQALTGSSRLDGSAALRAERYAEARTQDSDRLALDAVAAWDWRPGGGSAGVRPELRATALRDAFAGRDGAARVLASSALTLRSAGPGGGRLSASVWRGVRPPAFYELFGDRGSIAGSPDLVEETVLGAELSAGLDWPAAGPHTPAPPGPGGVEVAAWAKRATDLIQLRQASLMTARAFNVGEADLHGVEVRARIRLLRRLDLSGNYAYQRAVDAGDAPHLRGRRLPRRPDHEAFVRAQARLPRGLRAAVRVSHASATFLDEANLLRVPARTLAGAELDVPLGVGLAALLTAENLLDRPAQDFQGYPLPGRTFFASLRWTWRA